MNFIRQLPIPQDIKKQFPISEKCAAIKAERDAMIADVFTGSSDKFLLISTCLEKCGFTDKSRVYMVGDRFYDIEGAKAAGVHSLGVTYGFGSREEFLEAGAEYIVDSADEVARLIKG